MQNATITNVLHRFVRITQLCAACLIAAFAMVPMGCSDSAPPPAAAVSTEQTWEFDSPEDLIAYLRSMKHGRDLITMYEHMYYRTDEEKWALEKNRDLAKARLDLAKITNVVFGTDEQPAVDIDKEVKEFAAALAETTLEPYGESRMFVRYTDKNDEPATLVLARIRDKWMLHATTISAGQEMDLMWCGMRQNVYAHQLDSYQSAMQGLRKGAYSTPEETLRELDFMLQQPAPQRMGQ